MSWPLATFAIVFGVLLAGWLAYERSRPSARMTAVVGTLAAVAALGRDAFVALPDVKPITAMTFVVGYALGPLPGFAVGAIGMLASNIVLGQGPYTPWQMAAWGLVGLAGAGVGRLSGRRMGRVGIALACGISALGAKEIMNVYTWTIGANHTLAALATTASVALPFDVTDVVASCLFGLAFGPELARLLGRMRARMDVRWEAVSAAPLALAVLIVAGASIVISTSQARATGGPPSISGEVSYLLRAQNRDGGFGGGPGQRSSELYSAWAAMGLAAAGRDPLNVTRGGHSLLDSIRGEASTLEDAGDEERTILALYACGLSVHAFPGGDPVAKLMSARASNGSFGQLVDTTTFAIFALRAAGLPANSSVVRAAGRWLEHQQGPDGGFSFATRGASEDVDDTAAALQGVIDAGGQGGVVARRAVVFLRHAQNLDGGYAQQVGGASNAQSTAWAVQGLIAAGQNVNAVTRGGSRSPLVYLESLIAPDGSVRYSRTSAQTPVWVTAQALMALAGKPFPIAPVPRRPIARHASAPAVRAHPHTVSTEHSAPPAGVPDASLPRSPAKTAPKRKANASKANANKLPSSAHASMAGHEHLEAIALTAGVLIGMVLGPVLR